MASMQSTGMIVQEAAGSGHQPDFFKSSPKAQKIAARAAYVVQDSVGEE